MSRGRKPGDGSGDPRGEETRLRLLESARDLVAERGWEAVTVRAIAERAEVNLALIHYHFGSKAALLSAVLDRALRDLEETFEPQELAADLPAFAAAAVEVAPRMVDDPDVRVLMAAMMEGSRDAQVAAALRRKLDELRSSLADVVAGSSVPVERRRGVVLLLAALLDGILLHATLDPDTDCRAAGQALQHLLRGSA